MAGPDKFYLYGTRILAIAAFVFSVFSCFMAYHKVTFDEHPFVNDVFGIQCSNLQNEDAKDLCEDSLNTRYYSLFHSFDNFFLFQDLDGTLCGQRENLMNNVNLGNNPDIRLVTTGNLGDCSDAVGKTAAAFAILACIFAALLTFFLLVVQDFLLESSLASLFIPIQAVLLFLSFLCSCIAVAVYLNEIDPLRLEDQFCKDRQTTFDYCLEERGNGLWMLIATLFAQGLGLVLTGLWNATGSPPGKEFVVESVAQQEQEQEQEQEQAQEKQEQNHHHEPWYKSLHFWVQLIKYSELVILVVGISTSFTTIRASLTEQVADDDTITNINSTAIDWKDVNFQMDTHITLWQGLFCHPFGSKLFMWSVALDDHPEVTQESFGECVEKDVLECQMGYIMALFTSVNALAFQKDPKTMPLAFVIGFIMHFMSMVKLSWAIGAFMTEVFPGRSEIQPSYCDLWIEWGGEGSTCSIQPGYGLILTGAALGTVVVSFVGEVIIQQSAEYGVGTAFRTLIRRVKEKRWKDLTKETSARELSVVGNNASEAEGEEIRNSKKVAESGAEPPDVEPGP